MNPLDWLFRKPQQQLAPPEPSSFPTRQDAEFALKSGVQYGSPEFDAFTSNSQLMVPQRALKNEGNIRSVPQLLSPSAKPQSMQDADTYLAMLQLAALKNPIAGLGADPRKLTVDLKSDPVFIKEKDNIVGQILGQYDTKLDEMWSGTPSPVTALHESFHRGLKAMRNEGYETNPPIDAPTKAKEEYLVRYLMSQIGNPERGTHEEVDEATKLFQDNEEAQSFVNQLMSDAAREVQKRRPGGPR